MFVGYELFRNLAMGKRLRKKKKESFYKYLMDPGEREMERERREERREGGKER